MVKTDSSGKWSGDADIPWLGLQKKHQAAEQDQLQVGHCQWWLQDFHTQTATFLESGTEPVPAIWAENKKRTVVEVGKQVRKEIWKPGVSDHSLLVNHPVSYWKM